MSRFGTQAPLRGIVNNAGIADGSLSNILQVNVYGVKRVCDSFLPLLNPYGRIVNISFGVGPGCVQRCSKEDQALLCDQGVTWKALEDFIRIKGGRSGNAYGMSKALVNAYTIMLAREQPTIAINACSPGWIKTDLTRGVGALPPEAGTRAALLLLFGKLEGYGRYSGSDGLRSPLHRSRDPGTPAYTGP